MKIDIPRPYIAEGSHKCDSCPVALGLLKAGAPHNLGVMGICFWFTDKEGNTIEYYWRQLNLDLVADWIFNYDNRLGGTYPRPFSFHISAECFMPFKLNLNPL